MIQRALFISETYLKENSPLSAHTEANELYPFMKASEDTHIQEAIGSKLYTRLMEGITASPQNINSDERALLFKVRDALMWYICYDALPFLHIKIRNIGVVKAKDDNLESADRADVSHLTNKCKGKADFYLRIMQRWLCENQLKFPEYTCGCGNHADLQPNRTKVLNCDLAFDNNEVDTEYLRKYLNGR